MDNRTFYYARVSSKDQNLDRQLAAFKALGADERAISRMEIPYIALIL